MVREVFNPLLPDVPPAHGEEVSDVREHQDPSTAYEDDDDDLPAVAPDDDDDLLAVAPKPHSKEGSGFEDAVTIVEHVLKSEISALDVEMTDIDVA